MDMQVALPMQIADLPVVPWEIDYARLAEHRHRVFALIGRFKRSLELPGGVNDAVEVLEAIVACARAYFTVAESLLNNITASGAAPHREEHRRILRGLEETLARSTVRGAVPKASELAHALDALVLHEATIRLRDAPDWGSVS